MYIVDTHLSRAPYFVVANSNGILWSLLFGSGLCRMTSI